MRPTAKRGTAGRRGARRGRWPAVLASLAACLGICAAAEPSGAPGAPATLAALEAGIEDGPDSILAEGAEVLQLDLAQRQRLELWVRTGGRLVLTGEAVEAAARMLASGQEAAAATGLGEVVVREGRTLGPESSAPLTESPAEGGPRGGGFRERFEAVSRAAVATLSRPEGPARATFAWLALYGLLLVGGLSWAHKIGPGWRWLGSIALVTAFCAGHWLTRYTPGGADEVAQVDVVVDADRGPAVVWSALAVRPGSRARVEVRPGTGSCLLRGVGAASGSDAEALVTVEDGREPVAHFEAPRGARHELAWIALGGIEGKLVAEVSRRGDRLTGIVRNGLPRTWSDVRLLLPGFEPVKLPDLPPHGALLVDERVRPMPADGPEGAGGSDEGDFERDRLLDEVLENGSRPLLDRGLPVVVAWSEGPIRPARTTLAHGTPRGATLMVSSAGGAS